jgi:beta-1,4-mannosyl-glycoprotein beta-1,4-N-acetylglucosaminyltransferase
MYYDEDLILDLRLNLLNKYIAKFVIVESCYTHSGKKRELKFDIKKYKNFQDKIIYIPIDTLPKEIEEIKTSDSKDQKNSKILNNSLARENYQRNQISFGLKNCNDNDLVIISDVDEIPNLESFKYKKKISIFKQKMFYYKFNLKHPTLTWVGSKACKKKDLISPQSIRNIKSKIYPLWRLDVYFSKDKYFNLNFVDNGGWHFTNLKTPEDIHFKLSNFLHHHEYEESKTSLQDIKNLVKEKKINYDHQADKKQEKWKALISLTRASDSELPLYLIKNKDKYLKYFD